MKPVRPVSEYNQDAGYPSVKEALSRRDFIKTALTGASALGALMVVPQVAMSGSLSLGKRKPFKVIVKLKYPYTFWACRYQVYQIAFETWSKRLSMFLSSKRELKGIQAALTRALGGTGCNDIVDAKRVKKLHKKLAKAVAAHYKKRTRRTVTAPKATLLLRKLPRRPMLRGKIRIPHHP